MRQLILGGARSGKSRLAEQRAAALGGEVVVIATAQALDAEMHARIAAHQAQRPAGWRTVEEPLALAAAMQAADGPGRVLLVDCLTLWLTNCLLADVPMDAGEVEAQAPTEPGPRWAAERAALLAVLPTLQAQVLLIGNEVGHGIVPLGALNRWFVDESGRLHQALAGLCEQVDFVMAGCVLPLKR